MSIDEWKRMSWAEEERGMWGWGVVRISIILPMHCTRKWFVRVLQIECSHSIDWSTNTNPSMSVCLFLFTTFISTKEENPSISIRLGKIVNGCKWTLICHRRHSTQSHTHRHRHWHKHTHATIQDLFFVVVEYRYDWLGQCYVLIIQKESSSRKWRNSQQQTATGEIKSKKWLLLSCLFIHCGNFFFLCANVGAVLVCLRLVL